MLTALYSHFLSWGRAQQAAETARIAETVAIRRGVPAVHPLAFRQELTQLGGNLMDTPRQIWLSLKEMDETAMIMWDAGREGKRMREWGYDQAAVDAAKERCRGKVFTSIT